MPTKRPKYTTWLAWCVHAYTALGLVAAAGVAVLIVRGGPESFRAAFALMVAATVIDATDGTLARRVRVKEVLPGFDGRRLDDLIDFLNYTFLPLLLLWRAEVLPAGWDALLLAPLVASAYGFSQAAAKTDDGFFLGFPSYWNLIAFYLYTLQPLPAWFSAGVLLVFAALTLVPLRYLYTSHPGRLNRLTNLLGALWAGLLAWVLWSLPGDGPPDDFSRTLSAISLAFPAFYLGTSWLVSLRGWRRRRQKGERVPAGVP